MSFICPWFSVLDRIVYSPRLFGHFVRHVLALALLYVDLHFVHLDDVDVLATQHEDVVLVEDGSLGYHVCLLQSQPVPGLLQLVLLRVEAVDFWEVGGFRPPTDEHYRVVLRI